MESGGRPTPPSLQQQQQTGIGLSVLHQQLSTTGRETAAADNASTSGVRPPPFSAAVAALQQQQQRAAAATAGTLPMHLLRLQQQQHTLKQQQAAAAAAFAALQQQEHTGNATGGGGTTSNSSLEQQQALLAALQQQQRLHEQQQQALAAVAALPQSSPSPPQTHPVPPEKVFWVQCDRCDKWRVAPYQINSTTWVCEQNTWDPRYASCAAVEEADPTVAAALAAAGQGSGSNSGGSGNGTPSGISGSGPQQRLLKQAITSSSLQQQQHGKTSSGRSRNAPVTVGSASGAASGGGIGDAGAGLLAGRSSKGRIAPVSVEGTGSAPPTKKIRGKAVGSNSATSDSSSPLSNAAGGTSTSALMAAAAAAGLPFSAVALQHAEGTGASTLGTAGSASPHHPLLSQQVLLKAGTAATGVGEQQHSLLQQQLLPHMQQQTLAGTAAAVAAAAAAAQQQRAVSAAVAAAAGLPTPALLQQPHLLQLQLQQQLQQPQLLLEHWVQCDACNKWRRAPMQITTDKWYCRMNTWAPQLASCDAPEEPDPAAAEEVLSEAAAGGNLGSGAGRQQREAPGRRQRGATSSGARGKGKGRGKTPGGRGAAASFVPPLKGRYQEASGHHTAQQHRQPGDNPAPEDGPPLSGSRSTPSPIGGRIAAAGDSPSTVTPPLHPLLLQQRQQQQQQLGGTVSSPPPEVKPGDTTTRSNSVGLLQKQSSGDAAGVLQGCSAAAAAQFAAAIAVQQHQLLQAAAARLSGSAAAGSSAALPAATAAVSTPPASLSSLMTAGVGHPAAAAGSTADTTADAKAGEAAGGRGQMRWACCTSCGKWRRVPEDAVFKGGRFCCYMNVWNPALCSCAAPQEPFDALQPAATTLPKQQPAETSLTPHSQQQLSAAEMPTLPGGDTSSSAGKGLALAAGREDEKRKEAAAAALTTGSAAASTGASLLLGMLSQQASLHQQQRLQQLLSQQQEQQGGALLQSITGEGSSRVPSTIAGGRLLSGVSGAVSSDEGAKADPKGLSAASSPDEPHGQSGQVEADDDAAESSAGSASASGTLDSSRSGANGDAREGFWPEQTGVRGVSLTGEASSAAAGGESNTADRGEAEEKEGQQKASATDTSGRCAPASRPSPGDEDDPDHSSGNSSSNTSNTSSMDSSGSTNSGESSSSSSKNSSQSRGSGGVGACADGLHAEEVEVFAASEHFFRYLRQQLRLPIDASYHVAATGAQGRRLADATVFLLPPAAARPRAEPASQKDNGSGARAAEHRCVDQEIVSDCSKSGRRCRAEVPWLEEVEQKRGVRRGSNWLASLDPLCSK